METVNLLLPLTVALLLNFSPAAAIKCIRCKNGLCPDTVCDPNTKMCMSARISANGQPMDEWMGCGEPKLCVKTGSQMTSMTHGLKLLAQIDCCDTDLCNTQIPAAPSVPAEGTKTCPNRNKLIGGGKEIKCNKLETTCFKTGDSDSDLYGCSTQNACDSTWLWEQLLSPYALVTGFLTSRKPLKCGLEASAPPPQCQVCMDHCCSEIIPFNAPSGSKCVAARVKDSSGSVTVRKAIASAPLCSLSLTKAFAVDGTEVQLTCCDTDHCNTEVPEFQVSITPEPVCSCGSTDGLYDQLHKLIQGVSVLTKTCSTNSEVVQ